MQGSDGTKPEDNKSWLKPMSPKKTLKYYDPYGKRNCIIEQACHITECAGLWFGMLQTTGSKVPQTRAFSVLCCWNKWMTGDTNFNGGQGAGENRDIFFLGNSGNKGDRERRGRQATIFFCQTGEGRGTGGYTVQVEGDLWSQGDKGRQEMTGDDSKTGGQGRQ